MIAAIIRSVIKARWLVVTLTAALAVLSLLALRVAPLDAIPDIADPQIIVYAKWPRSPLVIETEVTEPIVRALTGSPDIQSVRATSHMGYSFVYVILADAGRREAVRQQVADRLGAIRGQLPADATVVIGPNASSVGWIFQYALVDRDKTRDLRELRLLNESTVKPALQAAAGVAEVASVGGLDKQYQVRLLPPLLRERNIALPQVLAAFRGAFQEAGGRTIEVTNREYQLRGSIETGDLDTLEHLVLGRDRTGQPVQLRDVGYLQVGYDLRRGIADLDGEGEVVGGIAIMEQGGNVLAVTGALKDKLREVAQALPPGVEIVTTYDRSSLIWNTLANFVTAMGYELLVVILVIVVALGSVRAALAPVCVLLLGTLFTSLPLSAFDQTINLFALAGLAIAIGEMADATIVIVENCSAELARRGRLSAVERLETIVRATATMTRPLLFSMLIIVASFLPIFFLGAREGRLFNPLAFSKTFAMAFSTLLTLFLLPAIIAWVFRRPLTRDDRPAESRFAGGYRRVLVGAIRHRYAVVGLSAVLLVASLVVMAGFERDYMPEMEEGSILYMPTTLPGLPSKEAGWILQQMDRKLKAFPEVERVFGKLGRADTATDPAPVEMIETTVTLKPRSEWRGGMTKERLVAEMNDAMQIVGYVNSWTQPINTRVMMQDTGIQTPVGLKIKGADLSVVEDVARQVEERLRDVPGTQSVIAERISRGYFLDARLDLARMARHGVTADEAMPTVQFAIGGDNVIGIRQPDKTVVPLAIQYAPEYLDTLAKVRNTPVITGDGRSVPLGEIADVAVREAPEMIRNDNGDLAGYIYVYLDGVTPTDYVERAQESLRSALTMPPGYSLEWTGSYRYAEEAQSTLRVVVPVTLLIMFALLVMAFRSIADSSLIMLSAPFALVGGIILQWALGHHMTTAVIIGYVSLFAVAVQTGIIMVEFIREAVARRPAGQPYLDAVVEGSVARLRPKLMTVATTVLGLLPIVLSTGSGLDITEPIATPTLGGMITSTIYVLFLIPCLFAIGADLRARWPRRLAPSAAMAGTVALVLLSAGCSDGSRRPIDSDRVLPAGDAADGFVVTFASRPDPLEKGDNLLEVTVRDAGGAPVTDARVSTTFSMAAMPSMNMPAMHTEAALRHEGDGRYRGTGRLSMSGTWTASIVVARDAIEVATRRFSVVATE
jgi:Cu(I)/Ag(I) efflux system membrane protein CusA/SilA